MQYLRIDALNSFLLAHRSLALTKELTSEIRGVFVV